MKNKSSLWMAVLTFTGLVMTVLILSAPPREAQAAMINAQAGFSLITSGQQGGDESLTVIDKASQKMIVYHLTNNGQFEVIGSLNYGGAPGGGR